METLEKNNIAGIGHVLVDPVRVDEFHDYPKVQSFGPELKRVVSNEPDEYWFVDLTHPSVVNEPFDSLTSENVRGDAIVRIKMDHVLSEINDLLDSERLSDDVVHMLRGALEARSLDNVSEFYVDRLVVRAGLSTEQIVEHHMTQSEIRNDVWSNKSMSTSEEVYSSMCPECFTVKSVSGGCACGE